MWIVLGQNDDMTPDSTQRLWGRLALATGVLLLLLALRYTDWTFIRENASRIIPATLAAVAISGFWHLARTLAWAACFPKPRRIALRRLFRVRIAAEAVSYVTVRGVAGEPLKVLLLQRETDAAGATAAVALERLAYILFTSLIVGVGALAAWMLMPLSSTWRLIFLGFALGSAGLGVGAVRLLRGGEGAETPRSVADGSGAGRTRAFVRDVGARLRMLARGDRRRMLTLAAASVVSYACMALEAWAVFRVAGVPLSITQAFAIETITRVTSFASSFIPANLGALEAASLAAAAAAGAPGGAILAAARRLRGLFWAALGFLVFPRQGRTTAMLRKDREHAKSKRILLYVAEDSRVEVSPRVRIAGLTLAERVVRSARVAGYDRVIVWAPSGRLRKASPHHDVTIAASRDEWRRLLSIGDDAVVFTAIGPGTVVAPALLKDALGLPSPSGDPIDVPAGPSFPVSGVLRVNAAMARDPERLATALCERVWMAVPCPDGNAVSFGHARLALRMPRLDAIPGAEATMRRATYKQTDAKLARFNRRMSLPISIALLRTPVSANMMSVFVFMLGMISAWLFSRGEYVAGVVGGALSLAASILDGCDGEIARLKYEESALGCWLETMGDYSYYVAVFVGLTLGAVHETGWRIFFPLGMAGLAGTVLSFVLLIFLRRTITEGRPETLHAVAKARFKADPSWWSTIVWRVSFVATRAAMPYGIFALALLNLLPVVVVLSAIGANVYWVSLVLKLRHLLGEHEVDAEARTRAGRLAPSSRGWPAVRGRLPEPLPERPRPG